MRVRCIEDRETIVVALLRRRLHGLFERGERHLFHSRDVVLAMASIRSATLLARGVFLVPGSVNAVDSLLGIRDGLLGASNDHVAITPTGAIAPSIGSIEVDVDIIFCAEHVLVFLHGTKGVRMVGEASRVHFDRHFGVERRKFKEVKVSVRYNYYRIRCSIRINFVL